MSAKFCNILRHSAVSISKQHLNHPNLLIRIFYHVHVFFHVRIIKDHFRNLLTDEDGLNKVKNFFIKRTHHSLCNDYGVKANEIWMHDDWFSKTAYGALSDGEKTVERFPPNNLTRWIIVQNKGFIRKGIEKVSKSVQTSI